MSTTRLRLGQLLVDAAMISQKDLDEVLAFQKTDGRRLGTLLVERGFINETQLTQILSHQLSVPWVSLLHIEFSRQLLNLVPHSVAEKFCMVPIYVRHVRGQGQTLYVAMDDPSNEEGLRACKEHSGLPVKAMIAPPSDIRNAIRVYYGVTAQPTAHQHVPETPVVGESRDTQPEAPSAKAEVKTVAPKVSRDTEPPSLEIGEASLSTTDFLISDPTLVSAVSEEPKKKREIKLAIEAAPPAPAKAAALAATKAAPTPPPPRAEHSSSPDIPPPPETLPDPGQASPFVEARERKAARVSVVEARPLPLSERLRPVLEGLQDAPPATMSTMDDATPSSAPVDTIPEPRGRAPRMIALTLLDGTTITLPAPRKKKERLATLAQPAGRVEPPDDEMPITMAGDDPRAGLTARDLVAALRAVCHGADPNEILGPSLRWEAVVAAMLSVLLKKGLVADWEFVDELRKI